MQTASKPTNTKIPILVGFDPPLLAEADEIAERDFEGNRAMFIRSAVREYIRREREAETTEASTEQAA